MFTKTWAGGKTPTTTARGKREHFYSKHVERTDTEKKRQARNLNNTWDIGFTFFHVWSALA